MLQEARKIMRLTTNFMENLCIRKWLILGLKAEKASSKQKSHRGQGTGLPSSW